MRLKRIIHLVYNPGHEGLNCTIRSCAHHIFFNSSMLKKKNKETNCYFLSFTHETTETISPNFLTRVESINKMEEAQEKKK